MGESCDEFLKSYTPVARKSHPNKIFIVGKKLHPHISPWSFIFLFV